MIEILFQYSGIIAIIITVADRLADETKTNKDDLIVGIIHKILRVIGLRFRDKLTEKDIK